MIEVKWYARGGQGGFTSSKILGLSAVRYSGKYAQAFPSFGPERRGAPVFGFTRIDDWPIRDHSQLYACDYAIVLDNTLMEVMDVTKGIKPGGILFINTPHSPEEMGLSGDFSVYTYDATAVALKMLGANITNTAMMAVMAAVTGVADDKAMCAAIQEGMPGRIAQKNIELVKQVYREIKELEL